MFSSHSLSCKSVDWSPYLTTQLVEEFVEHIRIFRLATERQQLDNGEEIEDLFFKIELERGEFTRRAVCCDEGVEKGLFLWCFFYFKVEKMTILFAV